MILKSSRVPASRAKVLANYLSAPGENESVAWIQGSKETVHLSAEITRIAGAPYGIRHVIAAPAADFSMETLDLVIEELVIEYALSDQAAETISVIQHEKRRAGGIPSLHWHLCISEYDSGWSRSLGSRFTGIRDEKVARICELRSREPITPGRFNREIYERLERERPELDLDRYKRALKLSAHWAGLDQSDWKKVRARSAYSSASHMIHDRRLKSAAIRTGVDTAPASLPELRRWLRLIASQLGAEALVRQLRRDGFELLPALNGKAWRLVGQGIDLGALDRLCGRPVAEIDAAMAATLARAQSVHSHETPKSLELPVSRYRLAEEAHRQSGAVAD
ncbi:hypothetical protein [Aliiruegeria sabulilitoris]|uniref:hypothetical protein n=1 Tax=Aliiruegeria sabulilitoris TaxID=1510458 RepID=UPI000836413C|nr:hypothetical protein [Aliiruegeria sabulilitoris]NDR56314.1 hypothetical protein [Pseudoruegeria sp. M32A2M]